MRRNNIGGWIPIAEAVDRLAEAAQCARAEACRQIANRFLDHEFRLAADKVVSQVRDAEYVTSLMLGETWPLMAPPMARTVDEKIQLTAQMFPPDALEADSALWKGEASFPVAHEGPLARVSYYGVRIREADLIGCFNLAAESRKQDLPSIKPTRKKPGPAPDPDWPPAVAKVTNECIAAGYKRPLQRGQKAAIQYMLLNYMADLDKEFSDDTAAKHAKTVIAALPDN